MFSFEFLSDTLYFASYLDNRIYKYIYHNKSISAEGKLCSDAIKKRFKTSNPISHPLVLICCSVARPLLALSPI